MKLLDPTPTPGDLDSRGFTAALQALLSIVLCLVCFGFAIEAIGWIAGVAPEPDGVTLPGRGGPDAVDYSPDTGWFILLTGIGFGITFAVLTVTLLRRAMRALRKTSKKARLAEQRERHAKRNRRKKGAQRNHSQKPSQ